MPIDPTTLPPQYNPLSGLELAQLCAASVYNKLITDSRLTPGITYKLFRLKLIFQFELEWQNELGEKVNVMVADGRVGVEVDPNIAPDDIRRRYGLEVPK